MATQLKQRGKTEVATDPVPPEVKESDDKKKVEEETEKAPETQKDKAKKLLEAKKKAKEGDAAAEDGFNPLIPLLTLVLIGGVILALLYTQWNQGGGAGGSDRFAKMVRAFSFRSLLDSNCYQDAGLVFFDFCHASSSRD